MRNFLLCVKAHAAHAAGTTGVQELDALLEGVRAVHPLVRFEGGRSLPVEAAMREVEPLIRDASRVLRGLLEAGEFSEARMGSAYAPLTVLTL
jgi:hypothetical protein